MNSAAPMTPAMTTCTGFSSPTSLLVVGRLAHAEERPARPRAASAANEPLRCTAACAVARSSAATVRRRAVAGSAAGRHLAAHLEEGVRQRDRRHVLRQLAGRSRTPPATASISPGLQRVLVEAEALELVEVRHRLLAARSSGSPAPPWCGSARCGTRTSPSSARPGAPRPSACAGLKSHGPRALASNSIVIGARRSRPACWPSRARPPRCICSSDSDSTLMPSAVADRACRSAPARSRSRTSAPSRRRACRPCAGCRATQAPVDVGMRRRHRLRCRTTRSWR